MKVTVILQAGVYTREGRKTREHTCAAGEVDITAPDDPRVVRLLRDIADELERQQVTHRNNYRRRHLEAIRLLMKRNGW